MVNSSASSVPCLSTSDKFTSTPGFPNNISRISSTVIDQVTLHLYHPFTQVVRSLWLLMMLLNVTSTRGAVVSMLTIPCSSVCSHGTCSYPFTRDNKVTVTCHCDPGWGGEHCSIPCSRLCGQGQCVFVRDQQVCLCPFGFIGPDCSQRGYDVISLLSMAQIMDKGTTLFSAASSKIRIHRDDEFAPLPENKTGLKKSSDQVHRLQSWAVPERRNPLQTSVLSQADFIIDGPLVGVKDPREQVERNVERDSNQCMQNFVCQNGGRCVIGMFGGFRCRCKPSFSGTFCETACPKPCFNGGRCLKLRRGRHGGELPSSMTLLSSDLSYVYHCVCPDQFTGDQCQRKVTR